MPATPYATLLISVNGAGPVTGGITVADTNTIQLSGQNTTGWYAQRWDFLAVPPGFTAPAGWSTDTDGTIYSTAVTPPLITLSLAGKWGKFIPRLRVNEATTGNTSNSALTDKSSGFQVASTSGLVDLAVKEEGQFGGSTKQWVSDHQTNLRTIDTVVAGIGGVTVGTPVANLAALRAVAAVNRVDNQSRAVGSPPGTWIFSSSTGAGFADDAATLLLPGDILVGAAGRWYNQAGSPTVATIAALRAAVSGKHARCRALAYSALGDGGGGEFWWNATNNNTARPDNAGTIIVPTALIGGTGCWERQYSGTVDARWFGAKGDVRVVTDAAMTASSAVLTSATAAFTASDAGKTAIVQGAVLNPLTGTFTVTQTGTNADATVTGAGSNCGNELHLGQTVTIAGVDYTVCLDPVSGANTSNGTFYISPRYAGVAASGLTIYLPRRPLITTVAGYTNATTVTLSATADVTLSGKCAMVGTNDTTALTAALAFPSVKLPAAKYFTNLGLVAGLPGQEIFGESREASILISTSLATGGILLPQADKISITDLGFWGICVDDKTSQWAILSDGAWASANGSGANFATINNTDSFTISLDAGIPAEASGVITVAFTNTDTTIQAVIDRINLAFHGQPNDVAMRTTTAGTQIRINSQNAGSLATTLLGGNAGTLAKLGLAAGTTTGSGTAAKDCRVSNILASGPVPGMALHNGVKSAHGCHRWNIEHFRADQLCGSNGNTGCGYGILIAGNRGARWDDIYVQGSNFGGRHVIYNSGGAISVKGGTCHGADMNSSTYHLFSDWTEGTTRNITVQKILAERQKAGETGTGCAEFTGVFDNITIEEITAYDCACTMWMASSYAYPAGLSKGLTIKKSTGVRINAHGCTVRGAQRIRAQATLIDPGYGTPSTYAGCHVQSNPDYGPVTIADDVEIDIDVISSTPSSPLHTSVVRLEPSGNGPTNVDVTALGHPGTAGLGVPGANGLITYQIAPRSADVRHRTPAAYTPGTAAPTVMGAKELTLTQGGSGLTTLTNLANGHEGQTITLRCTDDLTQISNGGNFLLAYGTQFRSTATSRIKFKLYGTVWEEQSRVGGDARYNAPATPARQQVRATANDLGSLGFFVYGADNCAVPYDAQWSGSQWIATDATSFTAYKNAGLLRFKQSHGNAVGAAINFSDMVWFDPTANEFVSVMSSTTLPSDASTDVLDSYTLKGNKVLTTDASPQKVISTADLPRTIALDSTAIVQFKIIGQRTGGAAAGSVGDNAVFFRTCRVKNAGGTVTLLSTDATYSDKDDAAWGVPTVTTDGATNIKINAVGLAAANITWSGTVYMYRLRP